MKVWLVEHGCAGRSSDWSGADAARPLDAGGWAQARAVGLLLAGRSPAQLIAAPESRCVDTLALLARRTGLAIVESARLAADSSAAAVVEFVGAQPDRTVVCTHPRVMRRVLGALRSAGAVVSGGRTDAELRRPGSVWELDLDMLTVSALLPMDAPWCADHPPSPLTPVR